MNIINHLKLAISRLFSYRDSSFWKDLVSILTNQVQEIDDQIVYLSDEKTKELADMSDELLLQEAKLYNSEASQSLASADRKRFVKSKILLSRSQGSIRDIMILIKTIADADTCKIYNGSGVYYLELTNPNLTHLVNGEITLLCQNATAAGNRCGHVAEIEATSFLFDSATKGLDNGTLSKVV